MTNNRWIIVLAVATMSFVGMGVFVYSRGVFLPQLAETFDGQRLDIALGFSLEMTVGALISPFLGRYLDRGSIRRVLLFGIAMMAAGYVALSYTQTLLQFYLVMGALFGFAMPCLGSFTWQKLIINWFRQNRGLALALGVLGASTAGVVIPPLATFLVEHVGWRMTYVIFGLVVAVTLVPVVVFVVRDAPDRPTPSPGSAEPSLEGRIFTTAETLKMPAFWAIAVVFGMMLCVFGAVMLHLYSHLIDQGMSTYQAATVLSVVAGCSALGKPAVGAMADWLGGRPTIWFALALQFIAMLIIAAVDTYAMALTAAVIYGFGYSGILPLRSFAMAATVGHRSFGSANGLLRPAMWPLQVSASPLAGYIYDQSGSYETAFYVLAGFVAIAALGPFFIPNREESAEPARRPSEETMEQPATGK